jgi:hypothetical protein
LDSAGAISWDIARISRSRRRATRKQSPKQSAQTLVDDRVGEAACVRLVQLERAALRVHGPDQPERDHLAAPEGLPCDANRVRANNRERAEQGVVK